MPELPDSPARLIGLKVDVDTLRGTREGVPALVSLLKRHAADATFYFSVGPDHTGRALRRAFRPGFASKVVRTSVLKHYGLKTLMYGVLLPGPHIGRKAGPVMRATRDAGFEVGLHTHDHVRWQDFVARRDRRWTQREFERGLDAFAGVFGEPPASHAAAGWQMNESALELEVESGLAFASDCRGTRPFYPRLASGARACLQLPTTLPTFDELLGRDGIDERRLADAVFERIERSPAHEPQVFTLHAELEGMLLIDAFERLLSRCRQTGMQLVRLSAIADRARGRAIPQAAMIRGEVAGRSGLLAVQGPDIPPAPQVSAKPAGFA
jgi:peptidoglycan/xylan/chitin deacetylase (PgdA/CDA1 family)